MGEGILDGAVFVFATTIVAEVGLSLGSSLQQRQTNKSKIFVV